MIDDRGTWMVKIQRCAAELARDWARVSPSRCQCAMCVGPRENTLRVPRTVCISSSRGISMVEARGPRPYTHVELALMWCDVTTPMQESRLAAQPQLTALVKRPPLYFNFIKFCGYGFLE